MYAIRRDSGRRTLVGAIAMLGGAGVIAGAALPWLTIFGGLQSFSGLLGPNGQVLAAGGVAAVLLGIAYGGWGPASLRYGIGGVGLALAVFSVYLLVQLLAVYRTLHGMFLPALGPGVFVAAAGALVILSTVLVDAEPSDHARPSVRLDAGTLPLIALAAWAGTIHLEVAPEHFLEYEPFGAFFLALGLAQIGWAALVALRGPSRRLLIASTANVLVVALWIASRTTGLPVGPDLGAPEAVGFADSAATLGEVILVVWAVWWLVRWNGTPRRF